MNSSLIFILCILILLISYSLQFNYLTYDADNFTKEMIKNYEKIPLSDKFKPDLELIENVKLSNKKTVCLNLVRNNLYTENKEVINYLKMLGKNNNNAKRDIYNYILIKMFQSCVKSITEKQIHSFVNDTNSNQINNADIGASLKLNKSEVENFISAYKKQCLDNKYSFLELLDNDEKNILDFIQGKSTRDISKTKKENVNFKADISDIGDNNNILQ